MILRNTKDKITECFFIFRISSILSSTSFPSDSEFWCCRLPYFHLIKLHRRSLLVFPGSSRGRWNPNFRLVGGRLARFVVKKYTRVKNVHPREKMCTHVKMCTHLKKCAPREKILRVLPPAADKNFPLLFIAL